MVKHDIYIYWLIVKHIELSVWTCLETMLHHRSCFENHVST